MDNGENAQKDDDEFPDADILRITTIASWVEKHFLDYWLMEMTYFLTMGLPPCYRNKFGCVEVGGKLGIEVGVGSTVRIDDSAGNRMGYS